MKTIKSKVRDILENYPETRDSDAKLVIMVWWVFNRLLFTKNEKGEWCIPVKYIMDIEKMESITRSRRKFQEKGKYPASPEVAAQRKNKKENIRETINSFNWDEYLN